MYRTGTDFTNQMIYCDNAATVCNTGAKIKKKKRITCVLMLMNIFVLSHIFNYINKNKMDIGFKPF